ncbi:hypothetical protein [Photobacterium sanguinicancri]|uniref:Chromosome partitioning protein ParA n=1 Tax=Photobacterium sanguinicancri TaxID=875932 RepID=A0AAW7Y7A4_9GAMM|nr:hypothetical protein [Photobacterium sanguinicancri]MDO6544252.1 hypothetical protein [Photobacterium sanguinicancri]
MRKNKQRVNSSGHKVILPYNTGRLEGKWKNSAMYSYIATLLGKSRLTISAVAVFTLVVTLVWQHYHHQERIDQLVEKEAIIVDQRDQINELLVELDHQGQDVIELEGNVSLASELLADNNLTVNLLNEKLEQLLEDNADKDAALRLMKLDYQRNLSKERSKGKARIRSSEHALAQEREALALQEANVNSKMGDVDDWEKKKAEFDKLYASSALEVENEKRIDKLMAQFNHLRVDLNVVNECDKDYLYRYNEAKSVLNHIRTFIQKYEMKQEYYFFVISNDSQITSQNRKICFKD